MARKHISRGSPVHGRGFTIIELLIGLAITAILLAALAAAFNASLTNYRENEDMFWAVNNARQALIRMTSEIRTAGYFDEVTGWSGVAYTEGPSNQCTLYLANHELIIYDFRQADKKLYLVKGGTDYVLCDNVTNATFTTACDGGGGQEARSVQISLTVQNGTFQRTLSAAAVLRRIPPGI